VRLSRRPGSEKSRRQVAQMRLVGVAPLPPTTGSSEDFKPPHRLRDSTMHRVHSKPNGQNQTEDSQISTSSERWQQNIAYQGPKPCFIQFLGRSSYA
jgi:hypothetical protein